jgi:hypothetical protein
LPLILPTGEGWRAFLINASKADGAGNRKTRRDNACAKDEISNGPGYTDQRITHYEEKQKDEGLNSGALQEIKTNSNGFEWVAFAEVLFDDEPAASGGFSVLDDLCEVEVAISKLGHFRMIFARVESVIFEMNRWKAIVHFVDPRDRVSTTKLDPIGI